MAIIEVGRFKLNAGTDEKAFLATEKGVVSLIHKQHGFINRHLTKGKDGVWAAIMQWESAADADGWGPVLMQHPDGQAFAMNIDRTSMHLERYEIVTP